MDLSTTGLRYLYHGRTRTSHTTCWGIQSPMCSKENVPGSNFVIFLTFPCSCVIGPDSRPLYLLAAVKVFPRVGESDPLHPVWQRKENFPCVTHARGRLGWLLTSSEVFKNICWVNTPLTSFTGLIHFWHTTERIYTWCCCNTRSKQTHNDSDSSKAQFLFCHSIYSIALP